MPQPSPKYIFFDALKGIEWISLSILKIQFYRTFLKLCIGNAEVGGGNMNVEGVQYNKNTFLGVSPTEWN